MKNTTLFILTLTAILLSHKSFSQTIGTGGLTCGKASAAFIKGKGAKDTLATDYEGTSNYVMAGEVYCDPSFGNYTLGIAATNLVFHSTETEDVLTGDYFMNVTTDQHGITGYPGWENLNTPINFTSPNGDAYFKRNSYYQDYFSYQCRIPASNDAALICKVTFNGFLDVGYQVYKLKDTKSCFPQGILE